MVPSADWEIPWETLLSVKGGGSRRTPQLAGGWPDRRRAARHRTKTHGRPHAHHTTLPRPGPPGVRHEHPKALSRAVLAEQRAQQLSRVPCCRGLSGGMAGGASAEGKRSAKLRVQAAPSKQRRLGSTTGYGAAAAASAANLGQHNGERGILSDAALGAEWVCIAGRRDAIQISGVGMVPVCNGSHKCKQCCWCLCVPRSEGAVEVDKSRITCRQRFVGVAKRFGG